MTAPLNIPEDIRKRIIDDFLNGSQIKDISKKEKYSTQIITRVLTTELTKLREERRTI